MTKFDSLKENFTMALERLADVLKKEKDDIVRDSAIKRFEIVFDLGWKTLKEFLEREKGEVCNAPKDCFRKAYHLDVLDYDVFWIDLTDIRNEIVHSYSEETAEKVYVLLPKALVAFRALENVFSAGVGGTNPN